MSKNLCPLGTMAIHFTRSSAVGQGDDAIVREGRIIQEDRAAADIMEQNA
jgi:hypothetical protein